jgi:hypothetical protein
MKWTDTGGKDFAQAPVGNHVARCVKVIDLGTQKNEYEGKVTFPRQVVVCWELPHELMPEGEYANQPFVVSKIYTASLSEKATLRQHLEMWRGKAFTPDELKGFDAKNIIGKPCMLSVIHNEKGKAKVAGVAAIPRGMEAPAQVNKSVYFSLEKNEYNVASYNALSKWYQEKIAISPEFADLNGDVAKEPHEALAAMDDDIAF